MRSKLFMWSKNLLALLYTQKIHSHLPPRVRLLRSYTVAVTSLISGEKRKSRRTYIEALFSRNSRNINFSVRLAGRIEVNTRAHHRTREHSQTRRIYTKLVLLRAARQMSFFFAFSFSFAELRSGRNRCASDRKVPSLNGRALFKPNRTEAV